MGRADHFNLGASETFRDATPAKPDDFGVTHVPRAQAPERVTAHHDMLGVHNDKHGTVWEGAHTRVVTPDMTIKTTQESVGLEHVQNYAKRLRGGKGPVDFKEKGATEQDQDNGRPRLVQHNGELWHIDGLHRVAAARSAGRAFKARVWDADEHDSKPNYGAAPGHHWGLVDHVYNDHVHDNAYIDEDTDAPEHEVRAYHEELHRTNVADHRHS